ncbi:MAG: PEP-CTERM sorting domain-containing protein [Pirellulales bacterium]|nr:PEP-CTERM sorting domain-containing protein [Pirellulales bacterium]
MNARWTLLLTATLLLGWGALASAEMIQFQEDISPTGSYQTTVTYIRSNAAFPGGNKGADSTWQFGRTATADDFLRCIAGYDISAIPAGSTINSVTLTISPRMNDTSTSVDQSFPVQLHVLTNDAGLVEGVSEEDDPKTGVTWFVGDLANQATTTWTTPGCDYDPTVLSSITLNPEHMADGLPNPPANASSITYVFQSSAAFVAAVQAAVNGDGVVNLLIRSAEVEALPTGQRAIFPLAGDETATASGSQRVTIPSQAPILTVDYTPIPEPSSLVLFTAAAAGLLGYAARRRG